MKPIDAIVANLLRVQSEQFRKLLSATYDPPSFSEAQLHAGETVEPISNVIPWDSRK